MVLTYKQLEASQQQRTSTPINLDDPQIKAMIAECRKPHGVQMELEETENG